MRVPKHQHRLPRAVVDAPCLETLVRLYRDWNILIWLKMSLFIAGDLD